MQLVIGNPAYHVVEHFHVFYENIMRLVRRSLNSNELVEGSSFIFL